MKRLLWLGAGLAIGALVVRAVTRKAQSYSPRGIAAAARDSGRNLVDSARDFLDDVRDGMHERERELRGAFLDGSGGRDGSGNRDSSGSRDGSDRRGEPGGDVHHPPEGTTR